jgi:uncharacterized protein YcnI
MRRNEIGSARPRLWRVIHTGAAGLIISVFGFASPASAHVTVTPSTTAAGAHAILQFSVGHGCGDSPTTKITIQIPAQITSVIPTRTALWTVEKQTEAVNPPTVDAHGNQIVQRVASVTYLAATPLPDGYREIFEIAVQLPETKGTKLTFPTIQTCAAGETAWIEVAQDGQNVEELALPAPGFVISEPADGGHHQTTASGSGRGNTLTFAALAAGLLGSVLGGAALFRQRRQT